jgi:hypothetical protein
VLPIRLREKEALTMFQGKTDYRVPLLRVLAEDFPEGAQPMKVCQQVLRRYRDEIPKSHLESQTKKGYYYWSCFVHDSRADLVRAGLVDGSVRGFWRLTQAGNDWLAKHPDDTHVSGLPFGLRNSSARESGVTAGVGHGSVVVPIGIDIAKLERIRLALQPEEFRKDWGGLYEHLLAEERAKSITPVTARQLVDMAQRHIKRIQSFLQGRGRDAPNSTELCDWIHWGYSFELHREAAALWQYVHEDEVGTWQYERTKKIALACRARVGL